MIRDQIDKDIIRAVKEHRPFARDKLRFLKSRIQKEEINRRRKLADSEVIGVIKTLTNQNKEVIGYNPPDTKVLLAENELWSSYLPKQLGIEEIENAIKKLIVDNNISEVKQFGKLMGLIDENYGTQVNMQVASKIARELMNDCQN